MGKWQYRAPFLLNFTYMKYHEQLNDKLWDKITNRTTGESHYLLKREVRSRLKGIAHAFMDFNDIPEAALKDIRVVGSSASYNYTEYSDLDLHLVIDSSKLHRNCPIVWSYLYALKTQFNISHDITIYGVPVELYTEPVGQPANSNGIFSITDNKWVKEPKPVPPTDNDEAVKAKTEDLLKAIEWVEGNGDGKAAKEVLEKIYDMRKSGLAKGGEFSVENLAFKNLRNKGALDKLRAITKEDMDKELSLESLQEEVKDMVDINSIIVKLTALKLAAKNIHYKCTSYAVHLLADKLAEAANVLDDMKEQAFLSHRQFPLTEEEYAEKAAKEVPPITPDNDRQTLISFAGFIDTLRKDLNTFKPEERAINVLCDEADSRLATAAALLYIQTRVTEGLNESEFVTEKNIEVEHCDGAEEKCLKDKKVKSDKIDYDKVGKTIERQEAENVLVAEESTLDKLSRKLGV